VLEKPRKELRSRRLYQRPLPVCTISLGCTLLFQDIVAPLWAITWTSIDVHVVAHIRLCDIPALGVLMMFRSHLDRANPSCSVLRVLIYVFSFNIYLMIIECLP